MPPPLDTFGAVQDVYKQAVKRQEDTVAAILKKASEQEARMAIEAERRNKVLAHKKLERQLNMEHRMECVDTSRKQQLYQREQLLHKIMSETDRVLTMQRERSALQMQRKEANMQARPLCVRVSVCTAQQASGQSSGPAHVQAAQARQKMVDKMDKLQQAKKFDKIASGEITLDSLMR